MEAVEEAGSSQVKRQRTKRPRYHPVALASSTSSAEVSGRTIEEEEDMANCLILLAQGGNSERHGPVAENANAVSGVLGGRFSSRRFAEAVSAGDGKVGFYVYECKTCNKSFPSFQALGGHRASHKKTKLAAAKPKDAAIDEVSIQLSINSFSLAEVGGGGRPRIHECSICGAEFSSGQALGGHMRRHRPVNLPEAKKERSALSVDLNLPAPSEDVPPTPAAAETEFPKSPSSASTSAYSFAAKPTLLFSSSALVDCHY